MTPDQLIRLKEYEQNLTDVIIHGCSINGKLLRDIDALYHDIYPTAAPTNFGCNACINEMLRTTYNTLLNA
jgi:hypothetical protein